MFFKAENNVMLKLHKEYFIALAKILSRKLCPQYTESFKIIK